MEQIKYSIIVPIYNCEAYIARCIDSILMQDYSNFELILVNDGSVDRSLEICECYVKRDARIKLIDKSNSGVSESRNMGLSVAKGEYIGFVDADDYIENGFLSEVNRVLDKFPNIELVNFGMYSDVESKNFEKIATDIINYAPHVYLTREELKSDFVNLWDNTMLYNIVNKIYRRDIIVKNNIKFSPLYFGEDIKFNRSYLNNINSMYSSDKCFYHYIREREGAITKKYKPDFFDIRKREFREFNEYFELWGIPSFEYYEYSTRRFIERVLGCIENVYCSDLKFMDRYMVIKRIIDDADVRKSIIYARPRSKKVKIMLIPIKLRLTLITMLMGKMVNIFKSRYPALFNHFKNRR